ncbi:hypothetical protein JXA32_03480 [Candidatus Sumerlaeota bacterium]|nr:hypothetical protein [Candidatus Sumerlaeota bacterium]
MKFKPDALYSSQNSTSKRVIPALVAGSIVVMAKPTLSAHIMVQEKNHFSTPSRAVLNVVNYGKSKLKMLHDRINELKELERDWDSYGAPAPTFKAISLSQTILDELNNIEFLPNGVLPSVEGGIAFIFSNHEKYANVEIDNDGDAICGMSDRINDARVFQFNPEDRADFVAAIDEIRDFLC